MTVRIVYRGGVSDSENLYIEGDNLDVLKLLQETYLGKVKMIYIDPPYNTGNDFVYEDDFAEDTDIYKFERSEQYDEQGNRLVQNLESNGRFHTDWLNLMYSRLKLAKNLLNEEGVFFCSVDEHEYSNLIHICNEIFGQSNLVGTIVWKNATDNNPSNIATEHEYILVYARNKYKLKPEWKSKLSDVKQVLIDIGRQLSEQYQNDEEMEKAYNSWLKEHKAELWPLDRYKYIDRGGVYTGSQSVHNPGREGYRYDVIHPITKRPCKQPLMGYRFPKSTMERLLKENRILFGNDEKKIIELKVYASEYMEKLSSVFELDGRIGPYDLKALFPDAIKVFTNPKPVQLIKRFISFVTDEKDIVLDFFSGSATTAHAVMQLNAEDGGHRQFIMVQLPEKTDESSEAYKAGYPNICEIGKERIRRAGRKIKDEAGLIAQNLDIGFRVLRLDSSNMQDVYYNPTAMTQDLLSATTDNIKPDRTPEDLLFQVMLDLGVELSSPIAETTIDGKTVFDVADGFLLACFDTGVTTETVTAIAQRKPYYAVFRDSSMADDSIATNFDQIFETYSSNTVRKVL